MPLKFSDTHQIPGDAPFGLVAQFALVLKISAKAGNLGAQFFDQFFVRPMYQLGFMIVPAIAADL